MYNGNYSNRVRNHKKIVSGCVMFFVIIILGIIGYFSYASTKPTIPDPTPEYYVNDFASILSSEQHNTLLDKAEKLSRGAEGVQVVVTTVKSLKGLSIEDYAYQMYNKYEIGLEGRGILVLLSTGDREIRIEVGYGLEDLITNKKSDQLLDEYAIPDLANNNFGAGLVKLQDAIINEIESYYARPNSSLVESVEIVPTISNKKAEDNSFTVNGGLKMISVILNIVALVVVIALLIDRNNNQKTIRQTSTDLANARTQSSRDKSSHDAAIRELEVEKEAATKAVQTLTEKYSSLSSKHSALEAKMALTMSIHPELDQEINAHIAHEFENSFAHLKNASANSNLINELDKCINAFSELTSSQQAFVQMDMEAVRKCYETSCMLRDKEFGENVGNRIREKTESLETATEDMLHELNKLKGLYSMLPEKARTYVDPAIISHLNVLIDSGNQAREDRLERERQAAEEARRKKEAEEAARLRNQEDDDRHRRDMRTIGAVYGATHTYRDRHIPSGPSRIHSGPSHGGSSFSRSSSGPSRSGSSSTRSSSGTSRSGSSSSRSSSSSSRGPKTGLGGKTRGTGSSRRF